MWAKRNRRPIDTFAETGFPRGLPRRHSRQGLWATRVPLMPPPLVSLASGDLHSSRCCDPRGEWRVISSVVTATA